MSAAAAAAAALAYALLADGQGFGQTSGEERADIVARAFAALDNGYESAWPFTETSTKDGVVRIAAYDPRRPGSERWALVSVDGQAPSDEDVETFLTEKQKSDEAKAERNGGHHAVVGIEPGSLQLVEETGDHWRFGFVPAEDNDEDELMRHVDGTLEIAKDGAYVGSITMKNSRPIKPAFGVRIRTFYVELVFGRPCPTARSCRRASIPRSRAAHFSRLASASVYPCATPTTCGYASLWSWCRIGDSNT